MGAQLPFGGAEATPATDTISRYVVLGGGIAGVACAEELARLRPGDAVTLVSASDVLKGVGPVIKISRNLEDFDVVERPLASLPHANLSARCALVEGVDPASRHVLLAGGERLPYDRLCVATGARPKPPPVAHPLVLTLRDAASVGQLCERVQSAGRVLVVGNGGIALELVHALSSQPHDLLRESQAASPASAPLSRGRHVTWAVKHGHVGDAFFDVDAARFLAGALEAASRDDGGVEATVMLPTSSATAGDSTSVAAPGAGGKLPQDRYVSGPAEGFEGPAGASGRPAAGAARVQQRTGLAVSGHAVGPEWLRMLAATTGSCATSTSSSFSPGADRNAASPGGRLLVLFGCELRAVRERTAAERAAGGAALECALTDGSTCDADVVVCALGVIPNTEWLPEGAFVRAPDGGLQVDRCLRTSAPAVWAAGDAATAAWDPAETPHWFQMRLWTQARTMGIYAARCMAAAGPAGADRADAPSASSVAAAAEGPIDFAFQMFAHVTRFVGFKVVLLGLYNGQKLEAEPASDVVCYSRELGAGRGASFVRVLLLRGRMQGAVLIGETDLEETLENLILNGLDLSALGPELLDPDVDLEDYFD